MPLTRLEHALVLTDELDATRDFYAAALGMQVGPRPPLGFPGYWLYVDDVACIHLAEWRSYQIYAAAAGIGISTRAPGTGPVDHIAFTATDSAGMQARLHALGIIFAVNEVPSAGLTQLFLHDPNGVKVEINVRNRP